MKTTWIATHKIMAGIAVFLAVGQIGANAQTTVAPPPALINFQGRLAKPDGTPVTDGNTYSLTLSLWDAQTNGLKRWEQTFSNVTVRNGVFAVLLNLNNGFTSGNTLDSALNNATYLQVQVGASPALAPRQQLVSNAYALKAGTVADGSISVNKLTTDLKNSILGGPAGGDLMGSYPSPQIKTDSSLLNKVSGTLLSISAATSTVDQSQPTTTAEVTSSAWQSFTPSTTGTLLEIDVQTGTTGAQIPATLSLYLGQGTTSTPLQTIPITINPELGLQAFPITANVTAGTVYTWAIGSNNNLLFGYTGGSPYAGGRANLGQQFDYQFQTKMRVTTAPATQVNAAATLYQTSNFYLSQNASVGPMLVKQYDPFTSGTYNTIGRSGLFQAASDILFGGMADTATGARSIRFGTWSANSATRTDLMTILNNGNVGIGTAAPAYPLDITGNIRVSGSNNGVIFPDGSKQLSAAIVSGSAAGGDLIGTYPNPTLATLATSLAKVSGGTMTSIGGKIGIGTSNPIQTLDVNGAMNVANGVIQKGGTAITSTTDLGLYSQTQGNWIRFVTNGGNFKWFSDSGAGTTSLMVLDPSGNLSANGSLSVGGGVSAPNGSVSANYMTVSTSVTAVDLIANNSIQVGNGGASSTASNIRTGNATALNISNNSSSSPTLYVSNSVSGGRAATFVGTLTASAKNFTIDDPLDPENKYLVHGCVESDERRNLYDGTVTLDDRGEATVTMPNWFQALNRDFRYQLTCIGGYAQVYIAQKMNNNRFKIAGGKPGLEISWMVTGVRQDAWAKANPMPVEQDKGADRGKYLTPEAFGLPASRGGAMGSSVPKTASKPDAQKLSANLLSGPTTLASTPTTLKSQRP